MWSTTAYSCSGISRTPTPVESVAFAMPLACVALASAAMTVLLAVVASLSATITVVDQCQGQQGMAPFASSFSAHASASPAPKDLALPATT